MPSPRSPASLARLLLLVSAASGCSARAANRPPATAPVAAPACSEGVCARRLAEGAYALVSSPGTGGVGANVGFVVTEAGVVMIDTGMPGTQHRRIVEEVAKVTDKKVIALIVTHEHRDHTLGGAVMAGPGVRVIAHEKVAESLARESPALFARIRQRGGELAETLRNREPLLVEEPLTVAQTLEIGGTRFELVPLAPAHSGGDLLVYLPAQRILFAGDVVVTGEHPHAADRGMDIDGWRAALERIGAMSVASIVPGHGEPCDKEVLEGLRAYLADLRTQARQGFAVGQSPGVAATKRELAGSETWTGRDTLRENLTEQYRRLALSELEPPCSFELPVGYEVTEGGGDSRQGWLRWGWRSPEGYRDFEVMWRPRTKDALTIDDARRNLADFNAENPRYDAEETGTKTLDVAGQAVPVLTVEWWFKALPAQGGPAEWLAFHVGEREYAIQFGTNVQRDVKTGARGIAALEAIAATFRERPRR